MKLYQSLLIVPLLLSARPADEFSPFTESLNLARKYLSVKNWDEARKQIDRALERDGKSVEVWELREQWAQGSEDLDEHVYALHMQRRLLIAQKGQKEKQESLKKRLVTVDPVAPDLLDMNLLFVNKLVPLAEQYEKEKRPHSAIRVHREILAIDPERSASEEAIQRISAAPDPSLAESAKPKNLLEGVSEEWIREFDKKHSEWENRAKLVRENYVTYTNAGYEVMVRAAEAMEQMNAFYRQFFQYGEDGKGVSRIDLVIFKNRDEYLKMGSGPPAEWSGGQFTGSTVETYIDKGGFEASVGTLFHEAAHQFVSLATTASGWLNEGLASFFEGTRILSNGTVQMNMPANHRLFPLVDRMKKGWMQNYLDGMDPNNTTKEPEKAPTFRIVLENKYVWGPPWYAPTWGVVYFCYNYQDPVDGRFVYRNAFRTFINSSGGRVGDGAVENFEKVVLANPQPPTRGVDFSKSPEQIKLPQTVLELDEVWKDWLTKLRDEQAGSREVVRPYLQWARHAITRKDFGDAAEHFEKGLIQTPNDVDLLLDFANFLATQNKNMDRATKLVLHAIRVLESTEKPDEKAIKKADVLLARWDNKRQTLEQIHQELWAAAKRIAQRYLSENLPMMAMDVAWRMGGELGVPGMYEYYEEAARKSQKTLALWKLAYNEKNLEGWAAAGNDAFIPDGNILKSKFGKYAEDNFDYQFLSLDTITSGDFSLEADIQAEKGQVSFCGLVFGKKGPQTFHALILFPGRNADPEKEIPERGSFVDLTSFYGAGAYKIWRHNPVDMSYKGSGSTSARWHKMRLDVTGRVVDVWFDGGLVVSQEFSTLDVLRGSFGLITGPGEARYRNIRYLARAPKDISASIERKMKMEQVITNGGSLNGSWLGQVPPWLKASRWIQEPRKDWAEKGAVPTVIAFWSIQQNDLIPIHLWLADLKKRYEEVGLQIVSMVSIEDTKKVDEYLQTHPFPGSLAVDSRTKAYIGESFSDYSIDKFFMPRILLLDLNQKVVWEGDPGFKRGSDWKEGDETYLDGPLQELIGKRNLKLHHAWSQKWRESGLAASKEGNLSVALPLLQEAKVLDGSVDAVVADAQRKLEEYETAIAAPEPIALSVSRSEREPALEALLNWIALSSKPAETKARTTLRNYLNSPSMKAWLQAKELAKQMKTKLNAGEPAAGMKTLGDKLATLQGPFAQELSQDVNEAIRNEDGAKLLQLLDTLEGRTARWLAQEYFKW